ncbi:MAG: DUF4080 domain-containing protein [Gammaproteobacteria bacterium]|nr:DUF4080 domain-containing protein [Gammaproteobacteria bacterium]
MSMLAEILLSTLNARYMHTAFALRYLYANLGDLQASSRLREFTIQQRPIDIVEQLLSYKPKIIGFSVYIWNVEETTDVINLLKQIAPQIKIIVGGPEVSFAQDLPRLTKVVDYVITGPGETSFYQLCSELSKNRAPAEHIIAGKPAALSSLTLPYAYYVDEDIRNRLIYVEASRGCPYKCEFCLSALDKTAKPFDLQKFLAEMDLLYQRGARNFKFIDRTFNLKVSSSVAILEFFLERASDNLYLHFEVVPDQMSDPLKQALVKFPQGSLQLEIGVQTFDPAIQDLISRKQDNEKTMDNLRWLRENTGAHIHADLIFGLPGDSLVNFAESFNQLVALRPQEIQLGMLKRLRGAPINRHTQSSTMLYNPKAPYNIISTKKIDFDTMQRINRFARFWDMIGNSGRFKTVLPLLLGDNPFHQFLQLSDALYNEAGRSWKISLKRLFELVYSISIKTQPNSDQMLLPLLQLDYQRSGLKGRPPFEQTKSVSRGGVANKRQRQHQ